MLDATEAEIQNNARKAGLVNAKGVTEEIVEANNEDTKDGGEDVTTDVAEASITDMEGVSNGRAVFQSSASSAATPLPNNAEVVNGVDTTAATKTTDEDIVEGSMSNNATATPNLAATTETTTSCNETVREAATGHIKLKIKGPKNLSQAQGILISFLFSS